MAIPDFMAWTIINTHKIKVTAVVSHDESRHSFRMETKFPFNVLAPDQSVVSKDDVFVLAPENMADGGNEDDEECPPAYNEEKPPPA